MSRQLATRHRHKRAVRAFDDLKISNDKCIVKGNRAEGLQPLASVFHELDANFSDFHGVAPRSQAFQPDDWRSSVPTIRTAAAKNPYFPTRTTNTLPTRRARNRAPARRACLAE